VRLVQQPEQPPEIPRPARAQGRFDLGGVPPSRHDVPIGVLFVSAGAVQIVDKALNALSAWFGDLPDHRVPSRDAIRTAGLRFRVQSAIRSVFHLVWTIIRVRRNAIRLSRNVIRISGTPSAARRIITAIRAAIRA
jgi:hypothetical protein